MFLSVVTVVVYLGLAAWVLRDGRRRGVHAPSVYAIGTLVFAFLAVPLHFAKRPLRAGEVREGGGVYSFAKYFAVFCCALGCFAALLTILESFFLARTARTAEDALVEVLSGVIAGGILVVLFAAVGGAAFLVGLLFRDRSVVEAGPAVAPGGRNFPPPGGNDPSDV